MSPHATIATWFGCGYAAKGPGTAGSLAAVAIGLSLALVPGWHPFSFAILAALLTPLGIWAAGATARDLGREDPGVVVVDEVLGQWLTYAGAPRLNWKSWVLGFLLFRLFDIWKPFPVRRFESLPGGFGIVADDLAAAVYAGLVLFLAGWFNFY